MVLQVKHLQVRQPHRTSKSCKLLKVSRLPHANEIPPRLWAGHIMFLILNTNNAMHCPVYNPRCETTSQHSCKFIPWTDEIQKETSMLLPSITLLQHHATHSNKHSQIKRKVHKENPHEQFAGWGCESRVLELVLVANSTLRTQLGSSCLPVSSGRCGGSIVGCLGRGRWAAARVSTSLLVGLLVAVIASTSGEAWRWESRTAAARWDVWARVGRRGNLCAPSPRTSARPPRRTHGLRPWPSRICPTTPSSSCNAHIVRNAG